MSVSGGSTNVGHASWKMQGCATTLIHSKTVSLISRLNDLQHHGYDVLKLSVNGLAMNFALASWTMQGLCSDIKP
jgi:hypothetical protein